MTLDEIGLTTATDKHSGAHDYLRTYDDLFSPLRHEPVRLLEMGVLGGDSLVTWAKYFDHLDARITGIDIEPQRCQSISDSRVNVLFASQTDASIPWEKPFDIIIDDAGHFATQQIEAFRIYWTLYLKPGGLYCIEDLHTYASPAHCDGPETIMRWLTNIATEMQGRGASAMGKVHPRDKWASIDTVAFRKGLAIIRKK